MTLLHYCTAEIYKTQLLMGSDVVHNEVKVDTEPYFGK